MQNLVMFHPVMCSNDAGLHLRNLGEDSYPSNSSQAVQIREFFDKTSQRLQTTRTEMYISGPKKNRMFSRQSSDNSDNSIPVRLLVPLWIRDKRTAKLWQCQSDWPISYFLNSLQKRRGLPRRHDFPTTTQAFMEQPHYEQLENLDSSSLHSLLSFSLFSLLSSL